MLWAMQVHWAPHASSPETSPGVLSWALPLAQGCAIYLYMHNACDLAFACACVCTHMYVYV